MFLIVCFSYYSRLQYSSASFLYFSSRSTNNSNSEFIIRLIPSKRLGDIKLLKATFPDYHTQILTRAYYLACQGGPLSQCEAWAKTHEHPAKKPLTSQWVSEILSTLLTNGKQSFLSSWMDTIFKDEFLCYDITSISSYSDFNDYIRWGHNRDKERLPPAEPCHALWPEEQVACVLPQDSWRF